MKSDDKFDHWAIVEVFGHNTYAGRVTEQAIGGASFVRVDVPAIGDKMPFTKLFGAAAIYGITIVSEQAACAKAAGLQAQPMSTWDIDQLVGKAVQARLLSASSVEDKPDDEDEFPL